jgi:hypothetical protein
LLDADEDEFVAVPAEKDENQVIRLSFLLLASEN